MVDVVTNRVFDTYNRFSPLNNNHNESLATLSTLKRFSKDQKYKRALSREADLKVKLYLKYILNLVRFTNVRIFSNKQLIIYDII